MQCPKCKSDNLRRSRRQGIKESLFYRAVLLAPFRCPKCGFRHYARSVKARAKHRDKDHTLAVLLGIRREKRRKFQRNVMGFGIGILLLLMAIFLVHNLVD